MILPEQKTVMNVSLRQSAKLWITSGILKEQKKEYLSWTKSLGWTLVEERQRAGWLGMVFV
jgi:ribosomal protein L11 methylase PrmA